MTQHMANSMTGNAITVYSNLFFVDSSASNHMMSHGKWFGDVKILENLLYVELGDDTMHPIAQLDKMPMHDGIMKSLLDVHHLSNITKNLNLRGQMVKWGLQVRFNLDG